MKGLKFLPKNTFQYLSLSIIIFFVYTFAGKFGLTFAFLNKSATAIWPPTGIAIAAFLLFGYRIAPAIFLGAFVVNLTTQGNHATSFGIALGNTFEGVVAYYLIMRFIDTKKIFQNAVNIIKFIFFAGILSTAVSATIGVTVLLLGGLTTLSSYGSVWVTWWLGDAGGAIGVAPLVYLWLSQPPKTINIKVFLEFILFIILVAAVTEFVFLGIIPFPYLCIPVLLAGAFIFTEREETVALFVFASIAAWNTIQRTGPYGMSDTNTSLIQLQFFLIVTAITTYIISAVLLERKQIKAGLESSEKRFRTLIEKSYDAFVLIDATSKILYASPSVKTVLGYSPEELIDTTGFNLVAPEYRQLTVETLAKLVLKPGDTVTIEYKSVRKDGKTIWVEATGTNLLFNETIHAVVVNFHDITERKENSDRLAREKAGADALLKSLGEGLIATDEKGKIMLVNVAACKMLHAKQTALMGKDLVTVIPMQDSEGRTIPLASRPMKKVLEKTQKIITSPHNYYVRTDKTTFPVRFTVTPIVLNKKLIGTVEIFRDITKEMEIDRAKTEFVSLASHQLRTPLTTIKWYVERLIREELGEIPSKPKEYLREVYRASNRMVDLINSLLNTSRIELGTFISDPKPLKIDGIISQVIKDFKNDITIQNLKIKQEIPKGIPDFSGDIRLLTIVLQNLISNAIKYSKKGKSIIIGIYHAKKGWQIFVKDEGYGIPDKDKDKVFSKMFRADNIKMVSRDGNGLGLYIVKSIVETTGGKISFESKENEGTTFTVWYPAKGMKKIEGTKELR